MRIKLLILSIIVSAGFSVAADAVLFGNVLETDWILTPEGVTNAILTTASTVESDPLAYPVATNALALAEGALAHAESAHGLTDSGGFAGGAYATTTDGGAVGNGAGATTGGAVGYLATATDGGAVGYSANSTEGGGAVGAGANATYGGAVGSGAHATEGGGAVGSAASTTTGGAVGTAASATGGGAVGYLANATYGGAVGSGASATTGGAVGDYAAATDGGAVGNYAMTSSGFAGGYMARASLDEMGPGTPIDAIQLGTGWNPDPNTLQIYDYKLMNADGSIPAGRMAATLSGYATAEAVVSGAVGTASAGNRYFWTSATNVVLSVGLTGGQVVNYAALRNTGATAITATASTSGWKWTGGSMTNSIPAGKMMTFGWSCDPTTGNTNAYATAASEN